MSDRDTKWRLDAIERRIDQLDRRLEMRLDTLLESVRELRRDVSALERTLVREHGQRIAHLEQRFMTDKEEES